MITLGYDFYTDLEIKKPNGLNSQKITDKNKGTSNIFQLYLPPYLTDMFNRFGVDFKIDSVDNLSKTNLKNKWIYVLDCIGDPRGWLGVYNPKDQNSIKSLFSGISKLALKQVREDKAIIMVYQPMEGYPTNWLDNDIYEILYKEIRKYKLNPKNILYVTGNWKLEKDFKKWKPKSKYSKSDDIIIHSFNNERFLDFENKWYNAKIKSDKKRRKYFLCFNRTMRGHRLYLLSLLHGKGLISKGFVSCQKFDYRWMSGYLHNIGLGKNLRDTTKKHIKEFSKGAPYIVDVDEWQTNHFDTSPAWPYEESFFSVTTNTLFEEDAIFLDEKIWKPILNHHPFIFVGCQGSLKELRKQGFKTFHPFIDESYDNQKHHAKRMIMISKEIDRLCSYTMSEMESWYEQLIPRLEHNYQVLFERKTFDDFVGVLKNAI
jgi:hypothetical protein